MKGELCHTIYRCSHAVHPEAVESVDSIKFQCSWCFWKGFNLEGHRKASFCPSCLVEPVPSFNFVSDE